MSQDPRERRAWLRSLGLLGVGLTEMLAVPGALAYLGHLFASRWGQGILGGLCFGALGFVFGTYRMWERGRWANQQETEQSLPPKDGESE